jgi:DNA uptake protein ComE-like DNA-binding protein
MVASASVDAQRAHIAGIYDPLISTLENLMTFPCLRWSCVVVVAIALAASAAHGQVGKSMGVVDANTVSEKDLLAVPHMTPEIVKAIMEKRPFASIVDLNALLMEAKITPEQAGEIYAKVFVHIDLNTATREEIMLVPGAGKKMAHEFDEYRPWKSWTQFEKEIGKYVGKNEVARLAQYCFIPINLNTASDEEILTIPGLGPKMLHEFKEYRPYASIEQFNKEIGKYVDAKEVARLRRYVVIVAD